MSGRDTLADRVERAEGASRVVRVKLAGGNDYEVTFAADGKAVRVDRLVYRYAYQGPPFRRRTWQAGQSKPSWAAMCAVRAALRARQEPRDD